VEELPLVASLEPQVPEGPTQVARRHASNKSARKRLRAFMRRWSWRDAALELGMILSHTEPAQKSQEQACATQHFSCNRPQQASAAKTRSISTEAATHKNGVLGRQTCQAA
jgi:hypothetical protein